MLLTHLLKKINLKVFLKIKRTIF